MLMLAHVLKTEAHTTLPRESYCHNFPGEESEHEALLLVSHKMSQQ